MCKPGGRKKDFQTLIKKLADIKAAKLSQEMGHKIRPYFCRHCEMWCLTRQAPQKRKNSKRRQKNAKRALICSWESEGGSYGD